MIIYTDPETGHPYTVDPATGRSEWVDPAVVGSATQLVPTQELPVTRAEPPPRRPVGLPVARPVRRPLRRPGRAGELPRPRGVREAADGIEGARGRRPGSGLLRAGAAIGLVMLLVVGVAMLLGSRHGGPGGSPSTPSAGSAPRTPGIGTAVRDGKFEFRVTGRRTAKQLGNDLFNTRASGRYLLLQVTVRNISDQDKTFVSIAQKLYDTQGHEYTADAKATAYLGQVKNLVDRIGPGDTVRGTIVFDVPDGATPERVELHDSLLSNGVDVRLR